MDEFNKAYLQELLKQEKKIYGEVKNNLKRIWEQTIEDLVYYREPKFYERTYQLRDKFKVEFKDGRIFAYADTDNMTYFNSKGSVGGEQVVHWIDVGHDAGESPFGGIDYFWHYPSRGIIEEFYNRVKIKYPNLNIEVYRDTPDIV